MGRLRPNYLQSATIPTGQTSVNLDISHSFTEHLWVIEQIGINYSTAGDAPQVAIYVDGQLYSGPAQMVPTPGGLGQSFGGQPYLYVENDDSVQIQVTNGSAGAIVTIQVQYRHMPYDHDDLQGRF